MIAPLLALLPAALRGPGLWVSLALLAVSGGWGWLRLVHDPAVRREYAAEIAAQTAAQRAEDQRAAIAALSDLEADMARMHAASATIRERIIHVPVATACAASPAVAAAVDGLRGRAGGAGATGGAPAPAGLPPRP